MSRDGAACGMAAEHSGPGLVGNRTFGAWRYHAALGPGASFAWNATASHPYVANQTLADALFRPVVWRVTSLPRLAGCVAPEPAYRGSVNMSPNNIYRNNAEDCLRMAQATPDERDKPFWLTLAQSWLRLAEHAARGGDEVKTHERPVGSDTH